MIWNRFAAAAALACMALTLSACGDDDDDDGGGGPPPPAARLVKFASLDGAQETPAVETTARGAGVLQVDESNGAVSGFVVTTGLAGVTAAHVHLAARGTPGSVIVPLTGGPDVWVVPDAAAALTADQITAFRNDNLYFNVHTSANTGGEIRGQLDKTGTPRLASLTGGQETPPVTTTTAFGGGILAVDATTGEVSGFVVSSGLEGTVAHVHPGARGASGSPIVPLVGGPRLWVVPDTATALDAAQRTAFTSDGLYYNVHTAANGGGEIRGQLDKTGTLRLAALDGAQETPAVTTTGFGAGVLALDETTGEASGFVISVGLPTANNAHVHSAARGTPGGIAIPLTGGPDLWVIPDDAAAASAQTRTDLGAGNLYYNVHTPANTSGEIRGQLD